MDSPVDWLMRVEAAKLANEICCATGKVVPGDLSWRGGGATTKNWLADYAFFLAVLKGEHDNEG